MLMCGREKYIAVSDDEYLRGGFRPDTSSVMTHSVTESDVMGGIQPCEPFTSLQLPYV